MENVLAYLQSLVPAEFDFGLFLQAALVLSVGSLVLGLLGRLAFGKKSVLNQSVSSAIGILFIYAITIVTYSYGVRLQFFISPLPFISLEEDYLNLYSFLGADYVSICGQLLNAVILAFLANLANGWLPKGKSLLGWLFFRCLSVALAMLLHTVFNNVLYSFLPDGLLTWAPVILLSLLVLMLLMGALKIVVGAALGSISPVIGLLYTFFFSTVIGKQLSKAMLTAGIISGLVLALNYLGITAIFIGAAALAAYIPLLILLLVLWFVVGKLL